MPSLAYLTGRLHEFWTQKNLAGDEVSLFCYAAGEATAQVYKTKLVNYTTYRSSTQILHGHRASK